MTGKNQQANDYLARLARNVIESDEEGMVIVIENLPHVGVSEHLHINMRGHDALHALAHVVLLLGRKVGCSPAETTLQLVKQLAIADGCMRAHGEKGGEYTGEEWKNPPANA